MSDLDAIYLQTEAVFGELQDTDDPNETNHA